MVVFTMSLLQGQTVEEIKNNRNVYLWGEGTGTSLKQADNEALSDLIGQISVLVSSTFDTEMVETTIKNGKNKNIEFQESVRGIVSTYSQSALTNTERIVISNEPNARVLRYIKREDLDLVFRDRKAKVYDYVDRAEKHEKYARLADALRYYNWALALLLSHPEARSLPSESTGGSAFMHAFIVERVNAILEDIKFSFLSLKDETGRREVIMVCNFRGMPVINLDYYYWFGTDWSEMHTVKDGRTLLEFFGENAKSWEKTNIKIEYAYSDLLYGDKELEAIFDMMNATYFTKSSREIKFQKGEGFLADVMVSNEPIAYELVKVAPGPFKSSIDAITAATRARKGESVRNLFTPEGYAVFEKLLLYGNALPVDNSSFAVYRNHDRFISRGTYMSFSFQGGSKTFVEEVVFHFNKDQKVSTIAFGLGTAAVSDIYNHPVWTDEEKFVLVDFLEQYKTAYALKRLDYLESVFDDNAVIITGTVLTKMPDSGSRPNINPYEGNQIIQYNHYTKQEYMKRLEHVFSSREFINIDFEDNTLKKSNSNPNIFGVQIKQNYQSSSYSDQGYLFLLIDFSVRNEPTIHVRTWQPDKDTNGRIYGLEDF